MPDARQLLPLKPLVFETLLALASEDQHGWSLVRDIQERLGVEYVLPANFYRTLRGMMADGLIQESRRPRPDDVDERRRYFQLTPLGKEVARLEARRLEALVNESRARKFLPSRR